MSDSVAQDSHEAQTHQEGVDHVKQSAGISQQAPASNPGSDDPSGGIPAGSGGVSSTAYIGSPVPSQQKSVVESTIDTVKSYLGSLSLGGIPSGTQAEQQRDVTNEQQSSTSSGAVGGAVAGAAATASAGATAVASKISGDDQTQTKSNETRASGDPEAQTRTETSGSRDDDDSEQRKEGGDTSGEQKKGSSKRENPDAIPSAGGQRLGEAHWGESKVVPDVPPKRDSEAGQGGVSSAGGQPDKQTADNTARNTGGGDASGGGDEGKQKLTDKIKDKLGMGKE